MVVVWIHMAQAAPDAALTEKQRLIRGYLLENVEAKQYFKSRLIGEELDLSPKEVGTNIATLADADPELEIERWGYSSSTTWKVSA